MKKNTMKVTNRLWDAQPGASHYYFHDGNRGGLINSGLIGKNNGKTTD
jgi:hypothetical protein